MKCAPPASWTCAGPLMAKTGNTGIERILRAGGYSWKGFKACFRNEAAFRQELGLTVILLPLAFWLGESAVERALMIGVWLIASPWVLGFAEFTREAGGAAYAATWNFVIVGILTFLLAAWSVRNHRHRATEAH